MYHTPYHDLYQRGAHLVLSGSKDAQPPSKAHPRGLPETPEDQRGKIPLKDKWLDYKRRPTGDDVITHLQERGFKQDNRVGLIPGSLNLCVVDVDDPAYAQALIDALGEPLLRIPSRHGDNGNFHAYYPKRPGQHIGNWDWAGGQLRCDMGHVVLWSGEKIANQLLELFAPAEDGGMPLAFRNTPEIRLDRLPGLAEHYHEVQSGPPATGSRQTTKGDDPLPYPEDDEMLRFALDIEWVRRAFEEDPTLIKTGKTDFSPSVFSFEIMRCLAGYDEIADETIFRVAATYRDRYAEGGKGAHNFKKRGWYELSIKNARTPIGENREDEQVVQPAAVAPMDLDAPMISLERLTELESESETLQSSLDHKKQSGRPAGTMMAWDKLVVEDAINAGASLTEAVGVLRFHYFKRQDAPKRDETYFGDTVKTVQAEMPIPVSAIKDTPHIDLLWGVKGLKLLKVYDPATSAAPEFRFHVDGRAVHAGAQSILLKPDLFNAAVLANYDQIPKQIAGDGYRTAIQLLVKHSEHVTPGHPLYPASSDEQIDLVDALADYIQEPIDLDESDLEAIEQALLAVRGLHTIRTFRLFHDPAREDDGQTWLFLSRFSSWLYQRRRIDLSPKKLAPTMRGLGWERGAPPRINGEQLSKAWRNVAT